MKSNKNSSHPLNKSTKDLFNCRLKQLQTKLTQHQFDICIIDQSIDLFYYTGLHLSAGRLIVQKKQAALFIDGRYIQIAQDKAPMKAFLNFPEQVNSFLCKKGKNCIFDSNYTTYQEFLNLKKIGKPLQLKLIPTANFYQNLRAIKDLQEQQWMRESAQLLYKCFLHIRTLLKTGITEKQIATQFELFALKNGAEKLSFEPIIAFGPNSAMPHYKPQDIRLKTGDVVLIDIGVVLNQYHSDMTRVIFFKKAPAFLLDIYQVVKEAHGAALALCKPGIKVTTLDEAARIVMRKHQMEPYFLHSLGHGIGLMTHEFPRITSHNSTASICLEEGMTVTIEPGLYYANEGGIRYEDTIIITKQGYENLYPDMNQTNLIVGCNS